MFTSLSSPPNPCPSIISKSVARPPSPTPDPSPEDLPDLPFQPSSPFILLSQTPISAGTLWETSSQAIQRSKWAIKVVRQASYVHSYCSPSKTIYQTHPQSWSRLPLLWSLLTLLPYYQWTKQNIAEHSAFLLPVDTFRPHPLLAHPILMCQLPIPRNISYMEYLVATPIKIPEELPTLQYSPPPHSTNISF